MKITFTAYRTQHPLIAEVEDSEGIFADDFWLHDPDHPDEPDLFACDDILGLLPKDIREDVVAITITLRDFLAGNPILQVPCELTQTELRFPPAYDIGPFLYKYMYHGLIDMITELPVGPYWLTLTPHLRSES